jgi:hypothetical protein
VQVNGQTLIITGPAGDITVTFTTTTAFTKTSIGTIADITRGACITATGTKDATGAVTATTVRVSPKDATGCGGRNLAPSPGAGNTPPPQATPRPSPAANSAFETGEVTAVSGTSVSVLTQANGVQEITVAPAATVTKTATVSAAALQNGQCLRANGTTDASGGVQATMITITPAGPSGTCTTGLGGGGGRGPGAGGGQPAAGG